MLSLRKSIGKLYLNSLYIFCFSLPLLVPAWHGKIFIFFLFGWTINLFEKKLDYSGIRLVIIYLIIGAIYFLGLLYSSNINHGLSLIETLGIIFIVPFLVLTSVNSITNKAISYAFICFVSGVITLNLASLAFISKDLWDPINLQSNIIIANNNIVKIHPAYSSLYLSFSIFFILDQFFPLQTENRKKLGWVLFALVILIGYLIWINSRTGILSFFVAFIFYSFYRFRGRARIVSLSLLVVIFIIIFSVPFSKERFINTPRQVLFDDTLSQSSDPNEYPLIARKRIFQSSMDLLKWPDILYGYGTGDFRDVLTESLKQNGYQSLAEKSLDQHNEYFAQLHRHGIIGLGLFLTLLIIPFRNALKYRSPLLAVFIILFAITALFENVFSAQKGVTFFALMCPLLMLNARKNYEPESSAES